MRTLPLLTAVTALGLAGCSAGPTVKSHETATPAPATSSAVSATTDSADPPGKTCAQVIAAFSQVTGAPWRLRDDSPVDDQAVGKPGARQCDAEASSTAATPPAILSVTLDRRDLGTVTAQDLLDQAKRRDPDCTTSMAGPPEGTGLALSCTKAAASTLTESNTILVVETGWVHVAISAQHKPDAAATKKAKTFAAAASQKAATAALDMI